MIIRRLHARLRPTSAVAAGDRGASDAQFVRWAAHKGLLPGARGVLLYIRSFGRAPFLFVGRGACVRFPELLHAGRGCSIGAYSQVDCLSSGGVHLGARVTIREFAWVQLTSSPNDLGESLEIGDDTYVGPFAVLGAGAKVRIGRGCQVGSGLYLSAEEHVVERPDLLGAGVTKAGIDIGDDCWIGNRVTILDGVTIGRGAVIGAGAVVTASIPPNSIAAGIPARVLRRRDTDGSSAAIPSPELT
jgi:acetyltransferase-like isoleucine patch superfamily enzyme